MCIHLLSSTEDFRPQEEGAGLEPCAEGPVVDLTCWRWVTEQQSTEAGKHYNDVIMGAIPSEITSLNIVYSTVYSGADQRKHQSSASLAFVWWIHGPVNSPHKWPVTWKIFPFHDVIMNNKLTIKKTSKPHITGPLWWESTGDRWIPFTKGQQCRKRVMTLSCDMIHLMYFIDEHTDA